MEPVLPFDDARHGPQVRDLSFRPQHPAVDETHADMNLERGLYVERTCIGLAMNLLGGILFYNVDEL